MQSATTLKDQDVENYKV